MSYVKWEDANYCDIEIFRDNENVPELFQDLWVARLSTMRVVFTNHFGGGIKPECKLEINGRTRVTSGNVIETYLQYSGKPVEIACIADYGSFQVRKSTTIDVRRAYEEPRLAPAVKNATDIVCGRCMENGTLNPQGENLYLNAVRVYSPVSALDGTDQRNFCRMRLRYKTGTGKYGEWIPVLGDDDPEDEVKEIIPGISLSKRNTYTVQVGVVDNTGAEHTLTRQIPATAVAPFHLGKGGKNIGLGGFCDYSHTEAIDAFWDAWFHKRLEVLGDLEVKGDAQFSGDVNVDGLLTLNGGVGIREVFRATGSTGWSGGQLLSEAFPDADMKLLEQGTLFVAVLRNTVSYLFGTSSRTVTRREPVLCARVTGSVAGSSIDTISGCAVMFSNISGNYAPRCQHSYQFNIAKSGEDYLLESDYLCIYDATDYAVNGDIVLQPSQGIQKISSDSITIDALYAIL